MDYVKLFDQFRNLRVMVIGDVMLDAYIFGRVDRISPEAPVPVVSVEKRISRLGGAANVALNLKALGAEPVICSVIGEDIRGDELLSLLKDEGMSSDSILKSRERKTTTKFRVIGNNAQMLRVDEEVTHDLSVQDQAGLISLINDCFEKQHIDAVVLEDYNKGVLTTELISNVIATAKAHNVPVAVDPKKTNFLNYKGVTLFKPNLKELKEGLDIEIKTSNLNSLRAASEILHKNYEINTIMVTLSDEVIFISRLPETGSPEQHHLPAHRRNIADVSGAGDTVISVAALCLACNLDPMKTAALCNLAGGLVCEEVGVVPVRREKLLNEAIKLL